MVLKRAGSKIIETGKKFRVEFKKQIEVAVTASVAFLIALAWRDAITESVNKVVEKLELSSSLYFYKFLVAVIITIIGVLIIIIIAKSQAEEQVKQEQEKK